MRRMWELFGAICLVAISSYCVAQAKRTEKPVETETTVDQVLSNYVTHMQRTLLPLAMAMPEDKYGFAPTNGEFKGVRTFAQQLKHVATTNYSYASSILGEKPPVEAGEGEDGPASVKTKDEILKYVNDSFAYFQKAVATINAKNIASPIKSPFGQGETTRAWPWPLLSSATATIIMARWWNTCA